MDKKQKINNKGFTLIELMIVIVIVGILAAVAIPKFTKAQYKAVVSEFPTVLTQIYTAEGAYEAELMKYVACTEDDADDFEEIGVNIPSSNNFGYSVTSTDGTAFEAVARAKQDIGDINENEEASINQAGAKTTTASIYKYAPTWGTPPGS